MASEYTKHYYIEGQRIASKIGEGLSLSFIDFQDNGETTPIYAITAIYRNPSTT